MPGTFVGMALRMAVVVGVAALAYMAASAWLKCDGWRVLLGRLRRILASSPLGATGS